MALVVVLALGDFGLHRVWGAQAKPRLVDQSGHDESPGALAFSPDGGFLLTGSEDGRAILWSAATGDIIQRFHVQRNRATEPWLEYWEDETGIHAVGFSPDGRTAATAGKDGTVRLWSLATGEEELVTRGRHEGRVFSVAFTPDGEHLLSGGSDSAARLWSLRDGAEICRFEVPEGAVRTVSISPDGRWALTAGDDGAARLWSLVEGTLLKILNHESAIFSATFSPDGKFVLTGGNGPHARLWSMTTGREELRLETRDRVRWVDISPDSRHALTATEGGATLWSLRDATREHVFEGLEWGAVASEFSPTGDRVAVADTPLEGATVRVWDVASREELRRLEGRFHTVTAVAYAQSGEVAVTGHYDGSLSVWSLATGKVRYRLQEHTEWIHDVTLSEDGRYALSSGEDCKKILWQMETGESLWTFDECLAEGTLAPDGRSLLLVESLPGGREGGLVLRSNESAYPAVWRDNATMASYADEGRKVLRVVGDERIELLSIEPLLGGSGDAPTFERSWHLPRSEWQLPRDGGIEYLALTPDGRFLLTGHGSSGVIVWDAEAGEKLHRLEGNAEHASAVSVSRDGSRALTADGSSAHLWDLETGKELRSFEGRGVDSVALSPDGRFALTGGSTAAARLWSTDEGQVAATLFSGLGESWAVVRPDGRFDASGLEEINGLHWIMPDDPFSPVAVEAFMAEYYEPILLPRLIGGETFPQIPSVAEKNRVQPEVAITGVEPTTDAPGRLNVTVRVSAKTRALPSGGGRLTQSGIQDLRLFRDGQLVAYAPVDRDWELQASALAREEELERWRERTRIDAGAAGDATVAFEGIALPMHEGARSVELSAYAFNVDRVKSGTARTTYDLASELGSRPGRAYLVAVGVDEFESPQWDLSFAATDARRMIETLAEGLRRAGQYDQVVAVPLISEKAAAGEALGASVAEATKGNFRAVLDLLAGRAIEPEARGRLPQADRLRPAGPEDLVLITFSSHGYADERGNFYLFPHDIGSSHEKTITQDLLRRAISSTELTGWLRDVDAGDLVLIVDACHSAASVEGSGFKPGPMGSRGLGQLAYDKGMRILTATQADDVALESPSVRHGLLTYALLRDGLSAKQADYQPQDDTILLAEWLAYAVERVPELYLEIRNGHLQEFGLADEWRGVVPASEEGRNPVMGQRPSLFDFARKTRQTVLTRLGVE